MGKGRLAFALVGSCAVFFAAPAFAQDEPSPPPAADLATARALGQEGVKLADAGNCVEAIERLARAEKIFHAPTTLGRLGECQVQLGKIVEGTETLIKVMRESLAPNAPAAFHAAQERARTVLAEAKPKIAHLKVVVAAPAEAQLVVKIDNETIPFASLNTNRATDPGEHVIEATAPGFLKATAKVKLPDGGTDSVALALEPDPNAVKKRENTPGETPSRPEAPRTDANKIFAYSALGVGALGFGVGAVAGLLAIGKKGELDDACGASKQCGNDQRETIDSGRTLGTVSTIGFVIAVVGGGLGTYFLFFGPNAKSATTKPARPHVGLGSVGLEGTF